MELRKALVVRQDVDSPSLLLPPLIINSNGKTERHVGVEHWRLKMKPLEVSHHKIEDPKIMNVGFLKRLLFYIPRGC